MSGVSRSTAELALLALNIAAKRAQVRRNGSPLPARWVVAVRELEDVVRAGDMAMSASGHGVPVSGLSVPSLIGVGEAARRLRVSERSVRRWAGTGRLPARRVGGRALLIEWRPDGLQGGRAARDGAHG